MGTYVSKYKFTKRQKAYMRFKRCLDVIFALILLVVASPIMLIAAIWVKSESKGPVIFKQRRPGYQQKIFTIYKFRTMIVDVTRDGRALTNEERNTKSGLFLRKTSIDELPQLINILKGEMSFIGPRPFLINDLDTYNDEQLIRFDVLPGITSWTAIHGRASVSIQDKYNYEIYYVNNIGLKIDLEIFFKTVFLVLSHKDVEDVSVNRIGAEIIEDEARTSAKEIVAK